MRNIFRRAVVACIDGMTVGSRFVKDLVFELGEYGFSAEVVSVDAEVVRVAKEKGLLTTSEKVYDLPDEDITRLRREAFQSLGFDAGWADVRIVLTHSTQWTKRSIEPLVLDRDLTSSDADLIALVKIDSDPTVAFERMFAAGMDVTPGGVCDWLPADAREMRRQAVGANVPFMIVDMNGAGRIAAAIGEKDGISRKTPTPAPPHPTVLDDSLPLAARTSSPVSVPADSTLIMASSDRDGELAEAEQQIAVEFLARAKRIPSEHVKKAARFALEHGLPLGIFAADFRRRYLALRRRRRLTDTRLKELLQGWGEPPDSPDE